jgi:hypothetical protein
VNRHGHGLRPSLHTYAFFSVCFPSRKSWMSISSLLDKTFSKIHSVFSVSDFTRMLTHSDLRAKVKITSPHWLFFLYNQNLVVRNLFVTCRCIQLFSVRVYSLFCHIIHRHDTSTRVFPFIILHVSFIWTTKLWIAVSR